MDTMQAFLRGESARATKQPVRVFDWLTAVQIIKENGIEDASAGLEGDWEYTGGCILRDGNPVPAEDSYTYLASCWATPLLRNDQTGEEFECWVYQADSTWNSATFWPEEALAALNTR